MMLMGCVVHGIGDVRCHERLPLPGSVVLDGGTNL